MSGTIDTETIAEALAVIDASLGSLHTRELVSSNEVSDVLLDVRSILAAAAAEAGLDAEGNSDGDLVASSAN